MTHSPLPSPARPPVHPLPSWERLPLDRRQELTAILAALILKQLQHRPPGETADER